MHYLVVARVLAFSLLLSATTASPAPGISSAHTTQPTTKPTTEPTTKPTTKPTTRPTTKQTTKSTKKPGSTGGPSSPPPPSQAIRGSSSVARTTGSSTGLSPSPSSTTHKNSTQAPTHSPSATSCVFTTTVPGPLLISEGITVVQTYCSCGDVIAGINFAISGTSTVSYCAMGGMAPTGFSQIGADNGHPITPAWQVASKSSAAAASSSAAVAAGKCSSGATPDASCFNELDLPDYVQHWWTANEGKCGQQQFAGCFYALQTPYAPSNCGQLNNDAACTQPLWTDFQGKTNGIQNFYVAWNIWNINGFFLDLYTAIGDAEASASSGIAEIVRLLNPVVQPNQVLEDVLMALSFGLSLYSEGSVLVKAILRSMPQSTTVVGKLFPSGTVDGEFQDWSVVSQNLGKITDQFRQSVAEGLPMIQNNVSSFIPFSQTSGLSGFRPSLNGLAGSMTTALNTYVIARIISTQGFIVTRAVDTDVHALQTNGSQIRWDTGCSGGYTNGLCSTFFYDGTDTYALTDPGHFTNNFHDQLSQFITGTTPLTSGKLLFTGAQQCFESSKKNGGSKPTLDPQDPTSFSCLSNLQVCTWDQNSIGPFDASCPGSNVLPRFPVAFCNGYSRFQTVHDIACPVSYLGPGIWNNNRNVPSLTGMVFCDTYNA